MSAKYAKLPERMVSRLMAGKGIPQSAVNIVRPLMKNTGISREERYKRYKTIIRTLNEITGSADGADQ